MGKLTRIVPPMQAHLHKLVTHHVLGRLYTYQNIYHIHYCDLRSIRSRNEFSVYYTCFQKIEIHLYIFRTQYHLVRSISISFRGS